MTAATAPVEPVALPCGVCGLPALTAGAVVDEREILTHEGLRVVRTVKASWVGCRVCHSGRSA